MRWWFLVTVSYVLGHQHSNHHTHTLIDQMIHPGSRHAEIVSESDILMEEIMSSSRNVDGLFDADVAGKIGQPLAGGRSRRRRQVDQDDIKNALCRDKSPGEFFRLVAGLAHCRDVVACADHGLQAIRCPPGLAFDLGKQTCEWKQEVSNLQSPLSISRSVFQVRDCNQKSRPRLALPLLHTTEPVCQDQAEVACGDGTCLPRSGQHQH